VGKSQRKRPLLGKSVDRRIILKFIFKKLNRRSWTGFIWLRIWTSGRVT